MSSQDSQNEILSIVQMLYRSAARYGDKVALQKKREDGGWNRITYRQLKAMMDNLARGLIDRGIKPGDRVGLLSENRPEWGVSYLGILTAGAVVVPVDSLLKHQEIRHILYDSDVCLVITSKHFLHDLKEIKDSLPALNTIVSMEGDSDEGVTSLDEMIERGKKATGAMLSLPAIGDLAVLIYTSGTTGQAKGVMLSHKNIMADVVGSTQVILCKEEDNFLSVLPLHHTFECTGGFLVPLSVGASVTYARSLKSRDIIEDIQDSRATLMLGVPLLFEKMFQGIMKAVSKKPLLTRAIFTTSLRFVGTMEKLFGAELGNLIFRKMRKQAGLDTIRLLVSGAAPLDPDIAVTFNLLGLRLIQGYGLTEASPVLTVNPVDRAKPSSVGVPIPGAQIKIVDADEKGVGHIIARGDMIMQGYYKNPGTTQETIRDGWLYTGDSGWIDKEGYLYIAGRLKNVIVTRAGKNVYPEEVENELNKSRFILESLVYGATLKGSVGEEVCALIVPDYEQLDLYAEQEGGKLGEKEIEKIIREEVSQYCSNLADYKRVKSFQIRQEEFPKTSTKKIKRYLFRQELIKV